MHRQVPKVTVIRHEFVWMFWIDHTRFLMQILFMTTSQFVRWGRNHLIWVHNETKPINLKEVIQKTEEQLNQNEDPLAALQ
jgi:hypothetical protein